DLTTALSWFFKGLKLPLIPDDTKTTLYLNIASTYLGYNTDKHTSAAISYLQKAKNMPDTCMGVYDQKSAVFQMLGAISYSQGDYQKAISLYKKGVKMAEDRLPKLTINEYPEPVHAYNNRYYLKIDKQLMYEGLYDTYTKLGEFEKALEYYILSKQAAEEIYLEQNQNLVIMLESISEDEKTKSRIALLARDNKLKELTIKQSRTLNFGIAGVFIVLILIGLLFLRQNKLKNEHKTVVLEQKLFRLQMNPHFIFNVHSNILGFIENKNTDSAAKYLSTFSKLLRTTLESSRNDHIYLDEEINMIKDYLDLQILLYENKFEYTLEVDDKLDIDDVTIPPMLIQPFIENA
ncbi:histidine kinase, partial [bacterium]|nr:histidine kinase [bacterium]